MSRTGRRRPVAALVAGGVLAVVAMLVVVALLTSGGGSVAKSASLGPISTQSTKAFKAAIAARMRAQHLNYEWISCIPSGRRFEGVRVVRCNVDFGIDPHVEAYCSVLSGGRLLTSADDPAIPCAADKAGRNPKLITYG